MGQLVNRSADLALFPLPVQAGLTDVIDLTYPFMDGGISIMVRKGTYRPSLFGFLGPFTWQVRPLPSPDQWLLARQSRP